MLELPFLRKIIVRNARLEAVRVEQVCLLQELILVDCRAVAASNLTFMDDLPQLRSLGLVSTAVGLGILPKDVPAQTRARLEHLEIRRRHLYLGQSDMVVLSFPGYSRLVWLCVESMDMKTDMRIIPLVLDVRDARLETLKLEDRLEDIKLIGTISAVTSLDLDAEDWPKIAPRLRLSLLRELVLRNCNRPDTDLTACRSLQRLRLVGGRSLFVTSGQVRFTLPSCLQVLETSRLRPWSGLQVPTLHVDAQSFMALNLDEQTKLKARVANLYIYGHSSPQTTYFASSFLR
jgi:hypothetical protein